MTDISTGFIFQKEIGPDTQENLHARNYLFYDHQQENSFQIRTSANLMTVSQLGLLAQAFTQKVGNVIATSKMEDISMYFAPSTSHM